jgi:hypothetical protein
MTMSETPALNTPALPAFPRSGATMTSWFAPLFAQPVPIAAAVILALGVTLGGYLLGDGLRRSHAADRSVTVRGLAERDVMADLATWTLVYSSSAEDLAQAQAKVEHESAAIRAFFASQGFPADALTPGDIGVSQNTHQNHTTFTVNQRMVLRTSDIARAAAAGRRQSDLVRQGVALDNGSQMTYAFTRLDTIKPQMVAAATRDARAAAQQFAKDSNTQVGDIRSATQGYFTISARDGGGGDEGSSYGGNDGASPYKKVRVVTTVEFNLH